MEVTVRLPNRVYENVALLAQARQKSIGDIIATAVQKELAAEDSSAEQLAESLKRSAQFCSDAEVLALARLQMPHNERISSLLEKNGDGLLTRPERRELERLLNSEPFSGFA